MSDILQASDLEAAKKHDTFHSEVITGKAGGLAGGADIEFATNQVTGQQQKTLPAILDGIDWTPVGLFADGVTFTKISDFAIDANGTQWIYTGAYPFNATAGTVPSEPLYQAVRVSDHNLLSNRNVINSHNSASISNANGGSVQDFIDNSTEIITNYQQMAAWIAGTKLDATVVSQIALEADITIPAGRRVTFSDDGSFAMGAHSIVWNGQIEAGRRIIFTWAGDQSNSRITGTPQTNEWLCDWFGVVADGATDWRADGKAYALFKFSSDTKCKVVFTQGFYKTPLDNSLSDVTIRCESDVIFAGTVHAAINNDGVLNPQLNPKNVRWEGVLRSLERVGTYHCDGVWIDEIYIKDDEANSFSGFSAGVHFFKGTKNLTCPKITIENSKSSFAFGLDADDSMLPEGCSFGHIEIISSGVTGVYVRAKNSTIGSINVRNYAQNELADVQNIGLPGFTGDTSKTYGYVNSDSENVEVGNVTVVGSGLSSIAGDGINIGGGTSSHTLLQSRSSKLTGVHVRSGNHNIGVVDSRLSGGDGVVIDAGAAVEYSSITSAYNTGKGLSASAALLSGGKIECSFNGGEGASLSGSNCAISYLYALNNGDGLNNVDATSVSGYIGKVKTERSSVNTGGGLYITGASVGFEYSHESVNDGDSSLYAFFASNVSNLTCNGLHTTGSTNQAFRIVNVSDSSFNGVKIPSVDSGASVIGASLTNVSFMNSNNSSGVASNIGSAAVAEFNSVGMTV